MNRGYFREQQANLNRAKDVMRLCVKEAETRNAAKMTLTKQNRTLEARFSLRAQETSEVSRHVNQDEPKHQVKINDVRILDKDPAKPFHQGSATSEPTRQLQLLCRRYVGSHDVFFALLVILFLLFLTMLNVFNSKTFFSRNILMYNFLLFI